MGIFTSGDTFKPKIDRLFSDIYRKLHINNIIFCGYQCVYYQREANRSEWYGTGVASQL